MVAAGALLNASLRMMPVVPSAGRPLQLEKLALALATYRQHLRLAKAHRAYTRGRVPTVIATNDQGTELAELNMEGESVCHLLAPGAGAGVRVGEGGRGVGQGQCEKGLPEVS
jgi:hypothetical protein